MTVTINGTNGVTTPEVVLDNSAADGAQVVLKSSGYSDWNLDNYSGRLRAYYGATEYWTVDASGNVGIGTSSPTRKLTVLASNLIADFRSSAASSQIDFTPNGYAAWRIGAGIVNVNDFGVYDVTNSATRMIIDSSGRMQIGTNASRYSATLTILSATNSYNITSSRAGGGTGSLGHVVFENDNGAVGTIFTSGTTTSYNTSSDYRLKENVQPMTGALAKVAALKPCTYNWKADGSEGEGFIAHELAEVVPQCVTGEKDAVDAEGNPQYQGIDTSFLVATLTAAIQELKAINDAQAETITALTARVTALEGA